MLTHYTRAFVLLAALAIFAGCDSASVPNDVGSDSTVSFTSSAVEVDEDEGTVTLEVEVSDPGFKDPFEVTVNRSGGDIDDAEINLPSENTLFFPQSVTSGETRSYSFEIVDDLFPEGQETVTFSLEVTSGNVGVGDIETVTVTVAESETDVSTVSEARALDDGDTVSVTGIVTRLDGSTVYLQDDNAGIAAFDGDVASDVEPGTELLLEGAISEFRGLLQVSVDDYEVGRTGLTLPDGVVATLDEIQTNGEAYESRVVEVTGLSVTSPTTAEWETFTEYELTDGTNTIAIFISDDSPVAGETIADEFTYNGIVDQRDVYQFLSLREGDIQ